MHSSPRFVLLTGAGASQPLGLPLMGDLVDEVFLRKGSDLAQPVAHLALGWARANTRIIDFEFVYTLAHLLSEATIASPLAYPLAHSLPITWPMGEGQGTKSRNLSFGEAKRGAAELRERLREHIHDRLWSFDARRAADLYGPFLRPFIQQRAAGSAIDIFTTNYDRVLESIWATRLHDDAFGCSTCFKGGFKLVNEYSPSKEWSPASYEEEVPSSECLVRLYKLHGSLNWRRQGESLVETSADEYSARESTLIYPLQGVKDCSPEPFVTLFERWRRVVSTATDCVALGTSLRDPEIVAPLERTANQSDEFRLWLVDPEAIAVRERLPEAVKARCIPVPGRFGDANLGEVLAAAASSPRRDVLEPLQIA